MGIGQFWPEDTVMGLDEVVGLIDCMVGAPCLDRMLMLESVTIGIGQDIGLLGHRKSQRV